MANFTKDGADQDQRFWLVEGSSADGPFRNVACALTAFDLDGPQVCASP